MTVSPNVTFRRVGSSERFSTTVLMNSSLQNASLISSRLGTAWAIFGKI